MNDKQKKNRLEELLYEVRRELAVANVLLSADCHNCTMSEISDLAWECVRAALQMIDEETADDMILCDDAKKATKQANDRPASSTIPPVGAAEGSDWAL